MARIADSPIVRFYLGQGTDHRGRRIHDILSWDDAALESVHDYVQWLFPLNEPSAFNAHAPLVVDADRAAFAADPALATMLRRSFERMLGFYGFQLVGETVQRAAAWPERSRGWLNPHNHNYLRLTRIMKSLSLLGQTALARALGDALLEEFGRAPDRIGETTARYWRAAGRESG